MIFQKNFIQGNWPILCPKMMYCHKSGSLKEVKRYMKIILMVFWKKILLWGNHTIFVPKIKCSHNSGSAAMTFSRILLSERGKEVGQKLC